MADGDQGSYARSVVIEKAIEALVAIAWKRLEQWLHDRDRHRSGETRRECFERWGKALDEQGNEDGTPLDGD